MATATDSTVWVIGPKGGRVQIAASDLPKLPAGWTRVRGGGGASFAPPPPAVTGLMDPGGQPLGSPEAVANQEQSAQRLMGAATKPMDYGEIARLVLPSLAATLMGQPELSPFLGRFPALAAGLTRAAGAGVASTATDAGVQMLRGQPIDRSSLVRGAVDATGVGAGAGLAGGVSGAAEDMAASAASRGVHADEAERAMANATRALGRRAAPEEASAGRQMIRDRAPVGPPYVSGKSGPEKLTDRIDVLDPAYKGLLRANRGQRWSWRDQKPGLDALRADIAAGGDEAELKQFDSFVGGMDKLYAGKTQNPEQLDSQVNLWQTKSKQVSPADPNATVKKRVYAQLQEDANGWLRGLTPGTPNVKGEAGMGLGQSLNQQMSEAMNLRDILTQAWEQQVFHPAGGATNVHPGSWMERLNPMSNPRFSSRAAMLLTNPAVQVPLRYGPALAGPLAEHAMEMERQNQQRRRDSVRPAGSEPGR